MVGHYWLRNPELAPNDELRADIVEDQRPDPEVRLRLHVGRIAAPSGKPFEHLLLIGIGGSALGPQFVADALGSSNDQMDVFFFDNTDPDGFDRVFEKIGPGLAHTLVVVISKSGGTKETRNGMLEAQARFEKAGLDFAKHAVAVTGAGSELDQYAESNGWLARFPMFDWIGGRTSVMSAVGLVPAALQGFDTASFLAGAAAMDAHTREPEVRKQRRDAARADVVLCRRRRGQKRHGHPALQRSARALQQIPATARHGVVRQREGSRRQDRAPGHRGLRQQRLDRSTRLRAAAARRRAEFLRDLHRGAEGSRDATNSRSSRA